MRHVRLLLFCIIATLTGTIVLAVQAGEAATVVLDSWWNEGYARDGCEHASGWYNENRALIAQFGCASVTACTDMMPIVQSCQLHDPVAEVRDFEDRLVTYLSVDPECKGVHFTRYSGPNGNNSGAADAMKVEGRWTLFLDYVPGAARQAWQLNRKAPEIFTKGEGDPKEIAKSICAIVTGRGAKFN